MDANQQLFPELFERVVGDPTVALPVPVEQFPAGSGERRSLEAFQDMLAGSEVRRRAEIAGHRRAQEELERSRRQPELILNAAGEGIDAVDRDGYQLLEQRVQERTRELATLLEVSQNLASTLELKPLLNLILDQIRTVADYTGAIVTILEGDDLVLVADRGPTTREDVRGYRRSQREMGLVWERLQERECVLIGDIHGDGPLERAFRRYAGDCLNSALKTHHSLLLAPLVSRERVIGFLGLSHRRRDYYTGHHVRLVRAIANQAAAAIENARLYEQGQALAVAEERQRLARELHDSVSQALYGIALGARTARTLLERNQNGVAEALEYIASLAAAGMAEMRALIFELRPESLETEGLVAALARQAASLEARYRIKVQTKLQEEPDLPIEIKEVLYRVAQEALHNIVKHARARHVQLSLERTAESIVLDLRDDGVGFDPNGSFPGHLGLKSMRERVARLGGSFAIDSAPGKGTTVHVRVPRWGDRTSADRLGLGKGD